MLLDHTIVPLLPGNPAVPSSSVSARVLGPLTTTTAGMVEFLDSNRIKGRVFSNFMLANVLPFSRSGHSGVHGLSGSEYLFW